MKKPTKIKEYQSQSKMIRIKKTKNKAYKTMTIKEKMYADGWRLTGEMAQDLGLGYGAAVDYMRRNGWPEAVGGWWMKPEGV